MKKLIALVLFLPSALSADGFAARSTVGMAEILKMAQEKYDISNLSKLKQEAVELQAVSDSSLENPTVSYGVGQLRYNGGSGTADYDELTISQKISIDGSKSSLREQGRLWGEIAAIEGGQSKIRFYSAALLSGIRFYIAKQRFEHIEYRRNIFLLASRFLISRKFRSPQKQIEVQLIESKLEEVLLDTKEARAELDLAKKVLSLYIGDFSDPSIKINFLKSSKVKSLAQEFSKRDLVEQEIFSRLQKTLKSETKLAGKQWIPDLQIYYSQSNEQFSGGNRNKVLGIGIEVPLFNIGKNRKSALLAKKKVAEVQYKIKQSRHLGMKKKFLKQIRVGLEYLKIYDSDKISKKERSLSRFERDFKKGLVSAANFLEFEDSVHMIHRRKLESQYEIYRALLGLVELSGDESLLKELL